ncbi:MAG TPA: hypothetical protein PLX03_12845, partial [Candidatus Hydrogenedentes bacterium]|nr:hypothetical protein [Candidatus Hydrogenedentota bacterium]
METGTQRLSLGKRRATAGATRNPSIYPQVAPDTDAKKATPKPALTPPSSAKSPVPSVAPQKEKQKG